jgi:hypothetical protein
MASESLSNYLLSHRKRSALSQAEVAFLLGIKGGGRVCRHERFTLDPGLQSALLYEALYQRPIAELFPGLVKRIHLELKARVKLLEQKDLRSNTKAQTARKRQFLAAILPSGPNN